jgi:Flp pilus assembly protein TadD
MLQGTLDPNQVDSIIEEGRALIQGGNAKEAVECFVRAAEADPVNPKVWNDLGVALFISDQIQPAIEAFESAIRYDASFPDAYINLATAASKTGDSERVINTMQAAKAALPENVEIDAVYTDLVGTAPTTTPEPLTAPPASVPVAAPVQTAAPSQPIVESPGSVDPVEAHVMRGRQLIGNG